MTVTAEQALQAIETAFVSFVTGETERDQYDRAVEAALRGWRGVA